MMKDMAHRHDEISIEILLFVIRLFVFAYINSLILVQLLELFGCSVVLVFVVLPGMVDGKMSCYYCFLM